MKNITDHHRGPRMNRMNRMTRAQRDVARAKQTLRDMRAGSPMLDVPRRLIGRHPWAAAAIAFTAGLLLGRSVKARTLARIGGLTIGRDLFAHKRHTR